MGPQFTRSLVDILRSTLQRLEETADLEQDDLAVIELKKHIVRAIAELEIARSKYSDHTETGAETTRIDPATILLEPAIGSSTTEPAVSEPASEAAAVGMPAEGNNPAVHS